MLTVAGIVAIVAVINAVMPEVSRTSSTLVSTAGVIEGRISTQIEIIHAGGQDSASTADVWIKNVGASTITAPDRMDVFFGPQGNFQRIPYGTDSSCTAPCWYYSIENDTSWRPTATVHMALKLSSALSTGTTYYVQVVAPSGSTDAKYFTV